MLLVVIFLPIDRLFVLHPREDRLKGAPIDLAFHFLNSLLPAVLIGTPISVLVAGLRRVPPGAYTDSVAGLPLAGQALAAQLWRRRAAAGRPRRRPAAPLRAAAPAAEATKDA